MNVYKPLVISNLIAVAPHPHRRVRRNFRTAFLVEGTQPNRKQIGRFVERSLMLVTALTPVIGYDNASRLAHHANDNDMTLQDAALALGLVSAEEFDRIVDPLKMVRPFVASEREESARS